MNQPTPPSEARRGRAALWAAATAGVLASACCAGPLVLLALGVSGAWIGSLTALEPVRPLFLAMAAVALALAGRRLWREPAACAPGEVCALPRVRWGYRLAFILVLALVVNALVLPSIAHWFY